MHSRDIGSGRKTDLQPGFLQISHGFHGGLGRESGVRRGQALGGIEDSHLDKSSRARGGIVAGRDAGRSRLGLI